MPSLPPIIKESASVFSNDRITVIMRIIWNDPMCVKNIQSEYTRITGEKIMHSSISQCLAKLRNLKLVNRKQHGKEAHYSMNAVKTIAIRTLFETIIRIQDETIE